MCRNVIRDGLRINMYRGREGSRIGQREKLGCVIHSKGSVSPLGSQRLEQVEFS